MRMLNMLGEELLPLPAVDEFVGVIPTRSQDHLAVLIYNYIDPSAAVNYLSRNVVYLNSAEKKTVVNIMKSDRMDKIISGQTDLSTLRLSPKVKDMFSRAIELNALVKKYASSGRKVKFSFKGLKDIYLSSRYIMDSGCSGDCAFGGKDEKEADFSQDYTETIEMSPYSVHFLGF